MITMRILAGSTLTLLVFQATLAAQSQAQNGAGQPAFELFLAGDISGLFEFARVDAQIAVGRVQNLFQLAEGQGFVDGERAHNTQAQPFVDHAVERARAGSGDHIRAGLLSFRHAGFRGGAVLISHRSASQ